MSRFRFEELVVDFERQSVRGSAADSVSLSMMEFRLLRAFMERPRIVLARETLIDLILGPNADVYDRAIDCLICRLRRKLAKACGRDPIRTHRSVGYSFETTAHALS